MRIPDIRISVAKDVLNAIFLQKTVNIRHPDIRILGTDIISENHTDISRYNH